MLVSLRRGCLISSVPGSELGVLEDRWGQTIVVNVCGHLRVPRGSASVKNLSFQAPTRNVELSVTAMCTFLVSRLSSLSLKTKLSILREKYREVMEDTR